MTEATQTQQAVLDFVAAVRRSPAMATDPRILDMLEQAAVTSAQGAYGGLGAPIAPLTWEARTLFRGTSVESERVQVDVPFPTIIVGASPSISVIIGEGGSTIPTIDDIDVCIDLTVHESMNQPTRMKNPFAGGLTRDSTYVSLGQLAASASHGARMMCVPIPFQAAQLGVTFRWVQGRGIFTDAHCKLAFFARPMREGT